VVPDGTPTDARPALILRRLGAGGTITAAGVDAGITRKTVLRWRSPGPWSIAGFGAACDRVASLAASGEAEARAEIDRIVLAWTPPRIVEPVVDFELIREGERRRWAAVGGVPVLQARPELERIETDRVDLGPADQASPASAAEPDVLGTDGREIVASCSSPAHAPPVRADLTGQHLAAEQLYPKRRAPTRDEWVSMMADLALDPMQPASVRCAAIASGNAALVGQVPRRAATEQSIDLGVAEAARERGRDAGVPATVWQEARQNFLGPAPPEAEQVGDVVGFERAPPSNG
jgi:hypothetical protein